MAHPAVSADLLRALLAGCRRDHRGSQRQVHGLYYSFALSVARRYAHTRDEALEVVNDAFAKVFRELAHFDHSRAEVVALFGGWLRQIVVYTAIDRYRAEARHQFQEQLSEAAHVPANESTALDALAYDELLALIQGLPPAYRTVFNLYVLDGFTHEEIARQLRISVGASKSNLFKARAHLKQLLLPHSSYVYARNVGR